MADIHLKPGRASKPHRVKHVENEPCPNGGNHVLTNETITEDGEDWLRTFCEGCKESWGDLDDALNGARP